MEIQTRENSFTITLADGTQLAGLDLNGNNFISDTEVTPKTFAGKLGYVVISGNGEDDGAGLIGEHFNMELIQVQKYDGKYWFVLRDIPPDELQKIKLQSDVAYLSMKTGIDLD